MGTKKHLDEKLILDEYLNGKSSLVLSKEFNVSKPTILRILKNHDVLRKRDRCNSLDIKKYDEYYTIERICPMCGEIILTKAKQKTIACRNHFNKINENRLCRECSLELQIGEGNPFYGKKHTEETKNQISKSRKGKGMGKDNPMANPEHRKRMAKIIRKKWEDGVMEHVRNIFSDTMIETRRLVKIKSVIRSNKEKKIVLEIRNKDLEVIESFRVDTKICDMFIPKFNLIIEYNGDYWHCNPKKYDADYYHQVKRMYAKELWEYDKNKVDLIFKKGYNLEIVWESDLKTDPDLINKILKKYEKNE
jgi:hypothetical protein